MAGVEPSFGINAFNQAKYKNETETVAHSILNLLLGRPGYFPSMPELGLHIQDLIYQFWDEIDENVVKAKIAAQCTAFSDYIDTGELDVVKSSYKGEPLLIIVIPIQIKNNKERLSIGITQTAEGVTRYNYVIDNGES